MPSVPYSTGGFFPSKIFTMTLNEFLSLENDDTDVIFDYYLGYFHNLSVKNFPHDELIKLRGIAEKFLKCVNHVTYVEKGIILDLESLIDKFIKEFKYYRSLKDSFTGKLFNSRVNKRLLSLQDILEEIYSLSMQLINKSIESIKYKSSSNLKLDDFYHPEKSNKDSIKKLIKEAISLIEEDKTLKDKTKKQLVDYLEKVLKSLNRNYTNWSSVIGNIKEVIIVLAALVAIAEPIASHLSQAKKKLEETDVIIQRTSININYNSINETFNIENVEKLEQFNSNILLLNESKNILEE